MLEYITIQNFQAHDKARIDFDTGITTIVGPSDVGKSAVIRALRWVCTNEPAGDAFIAHGAKGATVKLVVDGRTITRRRSPGGAVNEYHLDETELKAFGRAVPDPIVKLLNLGAVVWQGQHDAPYWFAETAGEVSRQLNSIVNLGIIDEVLSKVATTRTRAKTKLEVAEDALTEAKAGHKGLEWVDGFAAAVGVVERIEAAHHTLSARAANLTALHAEALIAQTTQENAASVAQTGRSTLQKADAARTARGNAERVAELAALAIEYKAAARAVPDMAALVTAYDAAKNKRYTFTMLNNLVVEAQEKEQDVCQAEKQLKAAEAAAPAKCPTCGSLRS